MAKEILLTQGKVTLIDDDLFEYLNQWKWIAQKNYSTFYAARKHNGTKNLLFMHHLIVPIPRGMKIDHWDRNGLNNQRSNLRFATESQNVQNRGKYGVKSRYKGVFPRGDYWIAYIQVNKKRIHLGTYDTEEMAARVYDAAARKHFGEFAAPNLTYTISWRYLVKPA